jgi:hypothetical protein
MHSRFALAGISQFVFQFAFWFGFLILSAAVPGGLAQNTSSIFLTPVADAPFAGTIHVERTVVQPDGRVVRLKTIREVARDNEGRVYNVFRALVPATFGGTPPIMRIHFYDPETRNYTYLYPQQHTYQTGTVNHPPADEPAELVASPMGSNAPLNRFTKEEDLGTHPVEDVPAHGVRVIQTIPAASSGTGDEIVLTDEYWYSDDLHINVMVKHDDPRKGSITMTLMQVTRTEPDPSLFQIPEGYKPMGTEMRGTQ